MQNGISVYVGLEYDKAKNLSLIETAANMGFRYMFTSVQIPESVNADNFFEDFTDIVTTAVTNGLEIIVDVNAENFAQYDVEGITLRLDDGFDLERTALLTHSRKIQLNASTVTRDFLLQLRRSGADFERITALHNFYPHPNTGLDTYYFDNQNRILHDFGIKVGAFVPSKDGQRRLPLCEGLPTLEDCRNFSTDLSARFLIALDVDFVIIGDGAPTQEELQAVASLDGEEVIFRTKLLTNDMTTARILTRQFTRRADVSKSVIRAVEGRQYLEELGGKISPKANNRMRSFGDVTIDNENFGRYAGEVQILQDELPADGRVNTVAHILDEEVFLLGYLKPRRKFSFKFI
ncbi:MAG: MupG family TIM beta-alpha barrel fold protein [Selenomonadaceae bacterium]|nr:MupG family TIM beta-alpha barrel fold protein [Selenomonadaceae bacterium]